jgi:putative endonuclease
MDERHRLGRRAEDAVVTYLRQRGFQIEGRNLRFGYLEIDVVARLGPVIAVVEVRARGRGALTTSFGSLSLTKRRRIRWAGERLWRTRYQCDASIERMRFDAAAVSFDAEGQASVEYIEAAF